MDNAAKVKVSRQGTLARIADWRSPVFVVLGKAKPYAIDPRWVMSVEGHDGGLECRVVTRSGYVRVIDEPFQTVLAALREGAEEFARSPWQPEPPEARA